MTIEIKTTSTEIPRCPEYRGDINVWSRDLAKYVETILRQHRYDIMNLKGGVEEIISVVYIITEEAGVPEVDGNWRMKTDTGGNLVFERREASVWTEKGAVNA